MLILYSEYTGITVDLELGTVHWSDSGNSIDHIINNV